MQHGLEEIFPQLLCEEKKMPGPYSNIQIAPPREPIIKRRYSVTSDVVAFRRCARQYGAFKVHNYAPAHQTQLYFGTIVHQVLDKCHAHYRGLNNPDTAGTIPDNGAILSNEQIQNYFSEVREANRNGVDAPPPPSEIIGYFIEVENGLKSQGIRAITADLRIKAIRVLQYFNRLEGPVLYPLVKDTEHRLQADQQTHILHGVVDLLLTNAENSENPSDFEIWDYKGTNRIFLTAKDQQTYEFQMRVYARLYELKHGVRPQRVVLYFINELDGPTCPEVRPVNALLSVSIDPDDIDVAMDEFVETVNDIETSRQNNTWLPALPGEISEQDCAICDLRWNCPTPNGGQGVNLRYP